MSKDKELSSAIQSKDAAKIRDLINQGAKAKNGFKDFVIGFSRPEECDYALETELIELLLGAGADPNARDKNFGYTILIHAARRGEIEAVRAALKAGANPNLGDAQGKTPLMAAAIGGVFKPLNLKTRDDVEKWRDHPRQYQGSLQTCANAPEIIQALVAAGADVNGRTKFGWSALMYSVDDRREDTEQALVPAGAVRDGLEWLPFLKEFDAVLEGEADAVIDDLRALATKAPSFDVTNKYGQPLWQIALSDAPNGRDAVKLLVELGANPNILNVSEDPLLKWAVTVSDVEMVRVALAHGAHILATDRHGEGATEWAQGDKEMVRLINEAMDAAGSEAKAEEMETPDFTSASANARFRQATEELARATGSKPEPIHPEAKGGTAFNTTGNDAKRILQDLRPRLQEQGLFLFQCTNNLRDGERLVLLPTSDRYQAIAFMHTDSNGGPGTAGIIKKMKELEDKQPFELTGIGYDFLAGKFKTPVKDSRKLAKWFFDFCPDIENPAAYAKELKETGEFHLWWD